jgi:WD40 repeat protein
MGRSTGGMSLVQVDIWDHGRSEPVTELSWGSDTVTAVRFNPAEADLLASAGSDRSIALYDLRSAVPIRKLIMQVGLPPLPGSVLSLAITVSAMLAWVQPTHQAYCW